MKQPSHPLQTGLSSGGQGPEGHACGAPHYGRASVPLVWRARRLLAISVVLTSGCAAPSATPRHVSDSRPVAPDTLGAPDEGMPDLALRRANGLEGEPFGSSSPNQAAAGLSAPGWLGVELQANQKGQPGVSIVDVVRLSPASQAGLGSGDVIVQVDGQVVPDPVTLVRRIRSTPPGTRLSIEVQRQGRPHLVALVVEATPSPDELLERRFVGQAAPPIDGLTVVSGELSANWTALRGELVVLEFWAPWCGVCRLMHSRLNEWQSQWSPYGVRIIGVAALSPEQARSFAVRFGMGYAVAADPSEDVFRAYDVFAVPSLFLVDRRGNVVDASTGYSSQRLARMEKRLASLVGEGTAP